MKTLTRERVDYVEDLLGRVIVLPLPQSLRESWDKFSFFQLGLRFSPTVDVIRPLHALRIDPALGDPRVAVDLTPSLSLRFFQGEGAFPHG